MPATNTPRCPHCEDELTRDMVDNGVGLQPCGPFGCERCGYTAPEFDAWDYAKKVGVKLPDGRVIGVRGIAPGTPSAFTYDDVETRLAAFTSAVEDSAAKRIAAWLRECADEERATLLDGDPDETPHIAVSDEEAVLRERADMIERGDWRKP